MRRLYAIMHIATAPPDCNRGKTIVVSRIYKMSQVVPRWSNIRFAREFKFTFGRCLEKRLSLFFVNRRGSAGFAEGAGLS